MFRSNATLFLFLWNILIRRRVFGTDSSNLKKWCERASGLRFMIAQFKLAKNRLQTRVSQSPLIKPNRFNLVGVGREKRLAVLADLPVVDYQRRCLYCQPIAGIRHPPDISCIHNLIHSHWRRSLHTATEHANEWVANCNLQFTRLYRFCRN